MLQVKQRSRLRSRSERGSTKHKRRETCKHTSLVHSQRQVITSSMLQVKQRSRLRSRHCNCGGKLAQMHPQVLHRPTQSLQDLAQRVDSVLIEGMQVSCLLPPVLLCTTNAPTSTSQTNKTVFELGPEDGVSPHRRHADLLLLRKVLLHGRFAACYCCNFVSAMLREAALQVDL